MFTICSVCLPVSVYFTQITMICVHQYNYNQSTLYMYIYQFCFQIQVVEETVNRDTKTPGGTTGFSMKPATIAKYYLSAEFRSACVRQLREVTNLHQHSTYHHPDLDRHRIQKTREMWRAVCHCFGTAGSTHLMDLVRYLNISHVDSYNTHGVNCTMYTVFSF